MSGGHTRALACILAMVGATGASTKHPDKARSASVTACSGHTVEKSRARQGVSGRSGVTPSFSDSVSTIQTNDSQKLPETTD